MVPISDDNVSFRVQEEDVRLSIGTEPNLQQSSLMEDLDASSDDDDVASVTYVTDQT
jgi:hypothetical protein